MPTFFKFQYLKNVDMRFNNQRIILLSPIGTKNAMITIVKPVVRSEKEVTIAEVLEERLIHELKLDKNAKSNAEELAKTYRQSGTELPRCRLKATLYYMGRKFSEGISDMDIIDSGDKVRLHCKPIPCNDYRDLPVY